ncbi:RDD family protein [Sutcliffiella halmapala]|uniref:RDD family protein n=1 Tax=Sutcliffiella halmapala TaxID=79882 RepID=UPI000994D8A4|nr:RDD family protein [Sutcliffiella halmapala]
MREESKNEELNNQDKIQINPVEEEITRDEYRFQDEVHLTNTAAVVTPAYRFAGFWMRVWAYLLDLIIIWSIGGIVIFPIFRMLNIPLSQSFMYSPATIATTILWFSYFIIMTKYFKQTLGKMVFGLRVVDLKDTELSWKTVLFREGIGRYIAGFYAPVTFVVYLVAAFTNKKQGIHDLFADTSVVHEK